VNIHIDFGESESSITKLNKYGTSSESLEPNYILKFIGVSDEILYTSLKIRISKFNSRKKFIDLF
jgi:hypothetical protein